MFFEDVGVRWVGDRGEEGDRLKKGEIGFGVGDEDAVKAGGG